MEALFFKFNSFSFQGECQEGKRLHFQILQLLFQEYVWKRLLSTFRFNSSFFRENVRKGSAQHFRNQQPLIYRENVRKESVQYFRIYQLLFSGKMSGREALSTFGFIVEGVFLVSTIEELYENVHKLYLCSTFI